MRERRGCYEKTETPLKLDIKESLKGSSFRYIFDRCPVLYVDSDCYMALSMFSHWKNGKMLDAGGLGDQLAKYVDIMSFFDALWADEERRALQETKGKK